jgi:N-acetylglutamate synthase-like GNAT family acetyltransferase
MKIIPWLLVCLIQGQILYSAGVKYSNWQFWALIGCLAVVAVSADRACQSHLLKMMSSETRASFKSDIKIAGK